MNSNKRQSLLPERVQKEIATYTSSSYRETVERGYSVFSVAVPRDTIVATQRALVDNALSLQELLSQIFTMIAEKNPVFMPVFDYARTNPVRGGYDYVVMNENSIYSLIEEARRRNEIISDEENVHGNSESGGDGMVRVPSVEVKTYKRDNFLQKRVTDAIVKLKHEKSKGVLKDKMSQSSPGKKENAGK